MRPATFAYYKPDTLEHALELLARFGDDGRPLAGGQSLVPMMNLRLARPDHLVDINALPLDRIEQDGTVLRVGALVRHSRYLDDPHIRIRFPALHEAVRHIGHPNIRSRGTLGGSIAHADPSAELPLIATLYDAVVVVRSADAERHVAAGDFFAGAYMTALRPGEMITAVLFPLPPANRAESFIEFSERHGDFATAAVGVALDVAGGTIVNAAVACSGADRRPIRARQIEAFLVGRPLSRPDAAAAIAQFAASVEPVGDPVASAEFRKSLIGELTRRAVATACARAREQT